MSKVAICTINYGTKSYTIRLLKSLNKLNGNFEVFVLENGSTKNIFLKKDIPKVNYKIHYYKSNENLGFAGGNNLLIKKASKQANFDYYWLFNNDAVPRKNSMLKLLDTYKLKKDAGLVECVVLDESNKIWWAGAKINLNTGTLKKLYYAKKPQDIPKNIYTSQEINGAAMLISKKVINKIGYIDEEFFHTGEDTDYSLRAYKAGFGLYVNPNSVISHAVSQSSGGSYSFKHMYYIERGRILLMKKYNTFKFYSFFLLTPLWAKRILAPTLRELNFKASFYTILGIKDGLKNVKGKKF